jgi:tetratricopeptide (TPR) repeat protein
MIRTNLIIVVCLLILSPTVGAQSSEASKPGLNKPVGANTKPVKDPEAERLIRERRAQAQALLISLGTDAGTFADQAVRARTQARIAHALWEADAERARTLFRKAWDAAEAADAEGQQRFQEEIRQTQAKTGGGYAVASPPAIRREVLRLAASRDRVLGEELLGKLKAQNEQARNSRSNSFGDELAPQRLSLAEELLGQGDTERALQFAEQGLGSVSMQSMDFLSSLREKDPAAADQRYAAMLANALASSQSDANTISLLSSYIFTPHLYMTFRGSAVSSAQMVSSIVPANVSPELRAAFFRAALGVLLRPLAPPGQDQTTSGIEGEYLVIRRLMPIFQQYAPLETTAAMTTQLNALSAMVSERTRQADEDQLERGIGPEKRDTNREPVLLDQIDHAKTSAERDGLYFQLASMMASKDDLRARDYVDKIDDSDLRHSVRAYIDASMAIEAIHKKNAERALEIARTGELTHVQRAWVLSQAAKLIAKTDSEKALQLLDEALLEARRIEGVDADRPRAFFAIVNVLLLLNNAQGWDAMSEAIKAANSAEGFTGEDGELTFRVAGKGYSAINQLPIPEFDVGSIFTTLAKQDYGRAVDLARVFQREAPRATAVIAIARAVLDDKKK